MAQSKCKFLPKLTRAKYKQQQSLRLKFYNGYGLSNANSPLSWAGAGYCAQYRHICKTITYITNSVIILVKYKLEF